MKVKELRDLIDFISGTGLEEVNIETEEFKVRVKRSADTVVQSAVAAPQMQMAPAAPQPSSPSAETAKKDDGPADVSANYVEVKSPMIGTFYRSPNPDSPPFFEIGDKITAGSTVCIIEAMKLFNEIESEVSGTLVKILVDNASPVEYDQPLFLLDPS